MQNTMAICLECGNIFTPSRHSSGRYCSQNCYSKSRSMTIDVQFWKHTEKRGQCWLWTGLTDKDGYGQMSHNRGAHRTLKAHRVSWELHCGPIPAGICVCHHCDVPACVNPEHLFLGTQRDNQQDCASKGRQCKGEDVPQSRLTANQIKQIRELRQQGVRPNTLAKCFGVEYHHIWQIVNRRRWKHVT